MPVERSSVFEATQLGPESLAAPGVLVSADTRLQALGFEIKPKIETSRFRPYGAKYDTLVIPGKDWSEFSLTGRLDYTNIIYALASVVNTPAIATLGTNGRTWTFISQSAAPDVPQTYTVEVGSAIRAERALNCLITELGISFKRDSVELSGSAIGKLFTDAIYIYGNAVYTLTFAGTVTGGDFTLTKGASTTAAIPWNATAAEVQTALGTIASVGHGNVIVFGGPAPAPLIFIFTGGLGYQAVTMTGTFTGLTPAPGATALAATQVGAAVTELAAKPVIPGQINVYVDTTFGALGTSKLTRVMQADLKIGGRYNPLWTLNSSETSWAAHTESAPDITLTLKLEANSDGMAYLSTLRASDTVYIRIESTGPALPAPDAGQTYKFRHDGAYKVEMPNDFGDADGAQVIDWQFRGVQDAAYGKTATWLVQNLTTAL